jgi:hypothetical protein
MVNPGNSKIPMFWGHGKDDNVVEYICELRHIQRDMAEGREDGAQSVELLKKLGYTPVPSGTTFSRPGLRFESYAGVSHSADQRELADLSAWLKEALK